MNFYEAQAQAGKRSYWLVALFLCITLLIIGLTTLFVVTWLWIDDGGYYNQQAELLEYYTLQRFAWVAVAVCSGLIITAWLKWHEVCRGGAAIADSMGQRRYYPLPGMPNSGVYSMLPKKCQLRRGFRCRRFTC
ncbi:hypothetical protein [Aliamphritea spongicola]|nr:hypothetical protein [Aliamphritea spongicola]